MLFVSSGVWLCVMILLISCSVFVWNFVVEYVLVGLMMLIR